MIQIDVKSSANTINIPKNQVIDGDLVLTLHSELTQQTYTFNVVDEGRSKRFYKFTLDLENIPNGEYDYNINEVETGLIRIGAVALSTPEVVTYTEEVNIIQYGDDRSSQFQLQTKDVEYEDNGEFVVTPDNGFYGLKKVNVVVNVPTTSGGTYEQGFEDGINYQKSKLISTAITNNGVYQREDGYSTVDVLVPQTGYTQQDLDNAYASGWSAGYISGYTDGSNQSASTNYLTFNIISGGSIFCRKEFENTQLLYSKNGSNWTEITFTTGGTPITVYAGDIIRFKGTNYDGGLFLNTFSGSTAVFSLEGNVMSIVYGDNYEGQTILPIQLCGLFIGCTGLTSASSLLLPATTLHQSCYESMFKGCTSLTSAPELPATTMAYECYGEMFMGCTSLTVAPQLPATTLAQYCYWSMFANCTSLTTAPELPAQTLVPNCYNGMFWECSNLNHIKCLATDISASDCTELWVYGVSSTGTFVKASEMEGWTTGNDGIPTGWTIINNE